MQKPAMKSRNPSGNNYRKALLNKKTETLFALGLNCKRLAQSSADARTDPEVVAHEEALRVRVNRVLYRQLHLVDEALERLEMGEFGICQGCGSAIPAKRFQTVPGVRYCLACHEKASLNAFDV